MTNFSAKVAVRAPPSPEVFVLADQAQVATDERQQVAQAAIVIDHLQRLEQQLGCACPRSEAREDGLRLAHLEVQNAAEGARLSVKDCHGLSKT